MSKNWGFICEGWQKSKVHDPSMKAILWNSAPFLNQIFFSGQVTYLAHSNSVDADIVLFQEGNLASKVLWDHMHVNEFCHVLFEYLLTPIAVF